MTALSRNNVKVGGEGNVPMIFAHGYGCDQNMWRHVAPAFMRNYKVVLFDHVGHGGSDASAFDAARYATLAGYSEDLIQICEELDLKNSIFVGHSVSAMIGILAAIKAPQWFDKLVLIGPSPRYINDEGYVGGFEPDDINGLLESLDSNHLGWSATMAPVIMGNPDRPDLSKELCEQLLQYGPRDREEFRSSDFPVRQQSGPTKSSTGLSDPAVFRGRDRTRRGGSICSQANTREQTRDPRSDWPLSKSQRSRRDDCSNQVLP